MTTQSSKVAVITGGNSGIGYATAKELTDKGVIVYITGRRREAVEQAAKEVKATGLIADQSKLSDIDSLVAEVAQREQKIDLLLINAGITKFSDIEHATEGMFDEINERKF